MVIDDARKPAQPVDGLLEDMFDLETVERMKEAQASDAFQRVDLDTTNPEYRCPHCGYEWRGNPLPPTGAEINEDGDGEA